MSKEIVKVVFGAGTTVEHSHYAIYDGYDGRILSWVNLDDMTSLSGRYKLKEDISKQIDARCDGTAFFDTEEDAQKVIDTINNNM